MSLGSRERHAHNLIADVLLAQGRVQLRATGLSMLPTLWPGDVVTIESTGLAHIENGDLLAYARQDRLYIHRLVNRLAAPEGELLVTRGDCMSKQDPAVRPQELLGKVTAITRGNRTLQADRNVGTGTRFCAWMLCHCDLLVRLALYFRKFDREPQIVPGEAASQA